MEHYFTNNQNLKSEFKTIIYKHEDSLYNFTSDNGVFSKDKVDYGSSLLMDTYYKYGKNGVTLLDVGCGIGIMGIMIAKIKNTKVTLIDVNKRALHLTKMNAKNLNVDAEVFESNTYSKVVNNYDVIISNPPIRAGKAVVHDIALSAYSHLNKNGEVWLVIRKDQGAKSLLEKMKDVYSEVSVLEKSKGFYIIVGKRIDNE